MNFVDFCSLNDSSVAGLIARARRLKRDRGNGAMRRTLSGKVLAMIFEKPSTRTRVSFEAGMAQLGGHAIAIAGADSQMSRGEPAEDTARVLSSMSDAIMVRAVRHDLIERFASSSSVPVINGLSDRGHPCQVLADLMTVVERRGSLDGVRALWVGDVNNVCRSWIEAASVLGLDLTVSAPPGLAGDRGALSAAGVAYEEDPHRAARGADVVVTDVWLSMGDESSEEKARALAPYRVTRALLAEAAAGAMFMHCLPARRGDEVEAEVIDGPQSAVWDEAENRLHAQKALLEWLVLGEIPGEGA